MKASRASLYLAQRVFKNTIALDKIRKNFIVEGRGKFLTKLFDNGYFRVVMVRPSFGHVGIELRGN